MNKRSVIGIVTMVLLLCALVVSRAYVVHRATTLMDEIRSIDQARDPTAASIAFMRRHQSYFKRKTCDREGCQYRFLLTNRLLSTFRLATRSEIEVLVTVYHERLGSVMVDFTSYVFSENSPVVHVQEDFCEASEECKYFAINPHGRNVTNTRNGSIQFGQLAKREQRTAAWAFNIDCFKALHGCRDISEITPTIWKRTGPDRVSSRIRSDADSNAEAAQPLAD